MSAAAATETGPVAIICGGGTFPQTVAEAVMRQGRRAVLFPLRGFADADVVERFPHHWMKIGQVGWFLKTARSEGVRDVIMIGSLVRPAISQLALVWQTLLVLPRVIRAYYGGVDHLLSGVARIFEHHGFRLLGAHEVAPDILVPEGALGARKPDDTDKAAARNLERGSRDRGQRTKAPRDAVENKHGTSSGPRSVYAGHT